MHSARPTLLAAVTPHETVTPRETVLRRCAELVPTLLERAPAAEQAGQIPAATKRDLDEIGALRILQPARFGGLEADLELMVDVCTILSRGCPSTGWVAGNLLSHHWFLGMWPDQAQHEVWGADPDVGISSSLAFPAGRGKAVAGGYQVSGRWPFSSGVDCSDWVMLGMTIHSDQGHSNQGHSAGRQGNGSEPYHRAAVVPKADLEVVENWDVAGLAATGSKDLIGKELFIPEHRTVSPQDLRGNPPGAKVNPGPLYRIPALAAFGFVLAGTPLGAAQAALEHYQSETADRIATYSGAGVASFPTVQIKVGEAATLIDLAEMTLRRDTRELMETVARGEHPDLLARHKYRRNATYTVKLCVQAMEFLKQATGAKGLFRSHPFQRYYRDVMAAATHINLNWEATAISYGRVALGLEPDNPIV